jgi:hypothetical protein
MQSYQDEPDDSLERVAEELGDSLGLSFDRNTPWTGFVRSENSLAR